MSALARLHFALLKCLLVTAIVAQCNASWSIGIVVPRIPDVTAPMLKSANVDAVITNNIARTRITQIFENPNSRPVEADFYFPIPAGSDITDFVLYMDGKPVKGEVLGKEEAHSTYRDIVRRLKDPGLIEWSNKDLFRVRIFPIPANGEQKLEIELSQPLTAEQGYFRYQIPVKSDMHPAARRAPPDVHYTIRVEGREPIRNVYSPTHKIDTGTSDPKSITITADDDAASPAQNFVLYYETSQEDIALSLITHRTTNTEGFFSLRISPPWDESTTHSQPADYVFVLDTSGSMADADKMEQARKALRYCINLLTDDDRFDLLRFSTSVEDYKPALISGTSSNRVDALRWIDNLQARGGTNISEALKSALKLRDSVSSATGSTSSSRLFTVVFITDGLPTVGQTSQDAITKAVLEQSSGNVRIFSFGVGNDVNTRLLDSIAEKTRAASDYVAPGADLEVPVSRFFDKASRPALYNLELSIPGAQITEVYPGQLPDLFFGQELAVFGRYKNSGPTSITLSGNIAGEKKTFRFEKTFPEAESENGFLEKLWATRKVAWLLDQVRMAGESDELRKEIEELARKYSIVTPYTSYLAVEDKPAVAGGSPPPPRRYPPIRPLESRDKLAMPSLSPAQADAQPSGQFQKSASSGMLRAESGAAAVSAAETLRAMKSAETISSSAGQTRQISGKTFQLQDGIWKDDSVPGKLSSVVQIKYLSEAWFQLSENFDQLRDILALGEQVQVQMTNGSTLLIGNEGLESIEDSTLTTLGLEAPHKK